MTTLALLNDWQRGFPLVAAPFAAIAARHGLAEHEVIVRYRAARADGRLSRIGGVFAAGAGGAGLLAAMAVPPARLDEVAARVSALPGVNHNYEREHRLNLWFVVNDGDAVAVHAALDGLEAATGLPTLRLPMQRAYRIDLGFDLRGAGTHDAAASRAEAPAPLARAEWPLAALVEAGLPLTARPYAAWATVLGCSAEAVVEALQRWLDVGVLKRFGAVVRHHELGFAANAMAVFDVADALVDAAGAALAAEPRVSLAYRRERADGWRYNLYAMVHGRDREAVQGVLARLCRHEALAAAPHEVLFSCRRFKQTGPRRFAAAAAARSPEVCDAC